MSGFVASNDAGARVEDLTPERLDRLLGAWSDITVVDSDRGGRHSAHARRDQGSERWQVRVVAGDRTLRTSTPGRAATYDLLRSWAAADGWWQEAFSWRTE